MRKLISSGAEAKIYLDKNIIKERVKKSYRHPLIDEKLRKKRTKSEIKILKKARESGVSVPKILKEDEKNSSIVLEYIKGDKLSEKLDSYNKEKRLKIMKEIAKEVSILHKNGIIHADLTTSNMILKKEKVFIIDFGLSFFSSRIEDMAVDIHLLKQALCAKHFINFEELFESFSKNYKWEKSDLVLERLKKVESRGRYKN